MNKSIVVRIVSALVLIAVIAGVGMFAYRAGLSQGLTTNITKLPEFNQDLPEGAVPPMMYGHNGFGRGYGMPFHRGHFGFGFGIFHFFFGLFIFFIVLKALRMLIWGPRWGHMGHHGGHGWGRHWENGVPPMFEEWHKKAHNVPAGGGETTEDKKE